MVVFGACAEAYAIHADIEELPVQEQRQILQRIGTFKSLIRQAGPPDIRHIYDPSDSLREEREGREELLRRADLCKDDIDLPRLQGLTLVPDPDVFYETLIGMIKNELISYQTFASKKLYSQITELKNEISDLKNTGIIDFEILFSKEKMLDDAMDMIMRAELEKNSSFEILNAEKITPHFIKMMKVGKRSESLQAIKDDRGNDFQEEKLRKEHITKFYKNLYSKPENLLEINDQTIPDFLGPDICNSSVVQNSKLTEEEKNSLINEFSLGELDEAMKEAKSATASGPDGIGNAVLKKIWQYIRVPLKNYANYCIEKGALTDNFRTASIKLIPKKGDISRINNWRPISLLNCAYKIISKAINNRLKKISNRILSRAQKGFTGGKYIQECLINIIETIERCNTFEIPAFVLAIDQAKAFDSVRHDFFAEKYGIF
jgi:hypothetical protein